MEKLYIQEGADGYMLGLGTDFVPTRTQQNQGKNSSGWVDREKPDNPIL